MPILVLWVVMCDLVSFINVWYQRIASIVYDKTGGDVFFRNVGNDKHTTHHIPVYNNRNLPRLDNFIISHGLVIILGRICGPKGDEMRGVCWAVHSGELQG
jgi:hypothetical protein